MLPKRKSFKWNKDSVEVIGHLADREYIHKTSKGKEIAVKNLDVNHIKNIIAKVGREEPWREVLLIVLRFELVYRTVYNIK